MIRLTHAFIWNAEAVKTILSLCEGDSWTLVSSDVLLFEINNAPEVQRSNILQLMVQLASETIPLTEAIKQQATCYQAAGIQVFDAFHLASAEGKVDIFLTTDDRFLKKAQQIPSLQVKVLNPLQWLEEVLP